MQLDKIFSTQFLDATTWLPLDWLTGVTITILEIDEADGTTLSTPVDAQDCINWGSGFYRYYFTGMQDKLYEYFINPNTSSAVISSGWVDKRLNRLDSNVSDIRAWGGGFSVNMSGVTGSINNLTKLVREESDKIREHVTKENNDTKSHIDIAKWEINDTIESIEIPEADVSQITTGIGTLKWQFTKLSEWIKKKDDKEKSDELVEKEDEYSSVLQSVEDEYKTLLSSKDSEIEALKNELQEVKTREKTKENKYEAMVQVLEEEISGTKEIAKKEIIKTLDTL
jgi:hypothetical protein